MPRSSFLVLVIAGALLLIPDGLRGEVANPSAAQAVGEAKHELALNVQPDLVVDGVTLSDANPTAGASFAMSSTVRNEGSAAAVNISLRYYRSFDATISPSDVELGSQDLGSVSASGSGSTSMTLRAPGTPWIYYHYACAETTSDELDTTNNCSTPVRVTAHDRGATFSLQQTIETGLEWIATECWADPHAADLDADGDPDLVYGNQQQLVWYENLGGGEFSEKHSIGGEAHCATLLTSGDLDGDGDRDIVSTNSQIARGGSTGGSMEWYENTGDGSFSAPRSIATGQGGAEALYTMDVDGDGDQDLLSYRDAVNEYIEWYENTGGDGAWPQHVIEYWPPPQDNWTSRCGEIGRQEIAGSESNGICRTRELFGIYPADLDGDGDLDVVTSLGDGTNAWYENVGGGDFSHRRTIPTNTLSGRVCELSITCRRPDMGPAPPDIQGMGHLLSAADMDGDRVQDILTVMFTTDTITWNENLGDGEFSEPRVIAKDAYSITSVYAADLDADGDMDVLGTGETAAWWENLGGGEFSEKRSITLKGEEYTSMRHADLDGDGDVDILLDLNSTDGNLAWYENLGRALGEDDHGDSMPTASPISPGDTVSGSVGRPHDADYFKFSLDSAGWVTVSGFEVESESSLVFDFRVTLLSTEARVHRAGGVGQSESVSQYLQAGDYYLAVETYGSNTVDYSLSLGFEGGAALAGGSGFSSAWVAAADARTYEKGEVFPIDFDGDGDIDLLTGAADKRIGWYENEGGGVFKPNAHLAFMPTNPGLGLLYARVHGADLDGDQDQDVLVARRVDYPGSEPFIEWYENLGYGKLSEPETIRFLPSDPAISPLTADLDGDRDLDVLLLMESGRILWIENLGRGEFSDAHALTTEGVRAASVHIADLEGDGDMDILSAANPYVSGKSINWYENLGRGQFSLRMMIADGYQVADIHTVDIDGDGDLDVLSASTAADSRAAIAWHENKGDSFSERRVITEYADSASLVNAADLDGDGDPDVISSSRFDHRLSWHENLGGNSWKRRTIVQRGPSRTLLGESRVDAIHVVDMELDGDPDLLLIREAGYAYSDGNLAWHENLIADGEATLASDDHADTREFATEISVGGSVDGVIEASGDVDYFRFTISDTARVRVESTGPTNIDGFIRDPSGRLLFTNEADGLNENFLLSLELKPGDYYVAVENNSGYEVGDYRLSVRLEEGVREGGSGTLFSTKKVIASDVSQAASVRAADLDDDGDADVLAGSRHNGLSWYENLGSGGFVKRGRITSDGQEPDSARAADLDGDGDLDVVHAGPRSLSWYENEGGGSFSRAKEIAEVRRANSVHAADLDADGDLELIASIVVGDSVSIQWWENLGVGEFAEGRTIPTEGDQMCALETSDLDADGDLDLLSASCSTDRVAWYENLEGHEFSERRDLATNSRGGGLAAAAGVSVADVDGDGDPDVISAADRSELSWHENMAQGRFSQGRVVSDQGEETSVQAADLDGEGDPDVLLASHGDDTIAWHENLGDSAFPFSKRRVIASDAAGAASVHAADLDGDGDLDVLSASSSDDTIAWYENLGGGSGFPDLVVDKASVSGKRPAASASFTLTVDVGNIGSAPTRSVRVRYYRSSDPKISIGDKEIGSSDLGGLSSAASATRSITVEAPSSPGIYYYGACMESSARERNAANNCSSGIRVSVGDDHGDDATTANQLAFEEVRRGSIGVSGDIDFFKFAVDQAGRTSIVSEGSADVRGTLLDSSGQVLAENDDGGADVNFRLSLELPEGEYFLKVEGVNGATGDFGISLAQEELAGTEFSGQRTISDDAVGASSVYAVDLDGDRDLDVLSASWRSEQSPDVNILWFENDGDGDFVAARGIPVDPGGEWSVYAADLDDDGDADLLSASSFGGLIAWHENLGDGDFSSQRVVTTETNRAESVHAADLDGDSDLDVLSASYNDNKIAWYEGLGGGGFSGQNVITTDAEGATTVYAADLDGDGDSDVLSASWNDNKIAWYENSGNGEFSGQKVITTEATWAESVYAADLDGDGDPDVLSASSRGVAMYENRGDGNFSGRTEISIGARTAESVYGVDLDGDGDKDVLSAFPFAEEIAWYENTGDADFSVRRVIASDAKWAASVHAADFDGDGDKDVLSASPGHNRIMWYENLGASPDLVVENFSTTDVNPATGASFTVTARVRNAGTAASTTTTLRYYRSTDAKISIDDEEVGTDGVATIPPASSITETQLIIVPSDAGTYYFGACVDPPGGEGDSANNCSTGFRVTVGDMHGDSPQDATALEFGGFRDGGIGVSGDTDYFSFTVEHAGWVAIESSGATDVRAVLQDASGLVIAQDDDGGPEANFRLAQDLPAGDYTLKVEGAVGNTGDYELSITSGAPDLAIEGFSISDSSPVVGTPLTLTATVRNAGMDPSVATSLRFYRSMDSVISSEDEEVGVEELGGLLESETSIQSHLLYDHLDEGTFYFGACVDEVGGEINTANNCSTSVAAMFAHDTDDLASLFSGQHVISEDADGAISLDTADLDGDGDLDVVSASYHDDAIAWHENTGEASFATRRVIASDADGAISVRAADLDGDGDQDVISAFYLADKIVWHGNLGNGVFSEANVLSEVEDGVKSIHTADIDGDGDQDVFSASYIDRTIAWYENLGGGGFSERNVIDSSAPGAISVYTLDWDLDGRQDVLSASSDHSGSAGGIGWYRNEAPGVFSARRAAGGGRTASMRFADLDGDETPDIAWVDPVSGQVFWDNNPGDGSVGIAHLIDTDGESVSLVHSADLDLDGDQDVLSGSLSANKINWYENDGSGEFSAPRVVASDARGVRAIHLADLDNDGDADLLSGLYTDDKIVWYENLLDHHGNSLDDATHIALDVPIKGSIGTAKDVDYFSFMIDANGMVSIGTSGNTNTSGYLYGADDGLIASDEDSGTGGNFMISRHLEAGTYRIRVEGSDGALGDYELTIDVEMASTASVPLDGPVTQGPVAKGMAAGVGSATVVITSHDAAHVGPGNDFRPLLVNGSNYHVDPSPELRYLVRDHTLLPFHLDAAGSGIEILAGRVTLRDRAGNELSWCDARPVFAMTSTTCVAGACGVYERPMDLPGFQTHVRRVPDGQALHVPILALPGARHDPLVDWDWGGFDFEMRREGYTSVLFNLFLRTQVEGLIDGPSTAHAARDGTLRSVRDGLIALAESQVQRPEGTHSRLAGVAESLALVESAAANFEGARRRAFLGRALQLPLAEARAASMLEYIQEANISSSSPNLDPAFVEGGVRAYDLMKGAQPAVVEFLRNAMEDGLWTGGSADRRSHLRDDMAGAIGDLGEGSSESDLLAIGANGGGNDTELSRFVLAWSAASSLHAVLLDAAEFPQFHDLPPEAFRQGPSLATTLKKMTAHRAYEMLVDDRNLLALPGFEGAGQESDFARLRRSLLGELERVKEIDAIYRGFAMRFYGEGLDRLRSHYVPAAALEDCVAR